MQKPLRRVLLGGLLSILCLVEGAGAQDVEMLGRLHGTRPPPAYYEIMRRDPTAFQFKRAMFGLTLRGGDYPGLRAEGPMTEAQAATALASIGARGPRPSAVAGTINFPLILGLYSDTPTPPLGLTQAAVQAEFFDGPQANPNATGTVPDYYTEVSGGLINLVGTAFDWQNTGLTGAQVAGGEAGTGDESRTSEYIVRILNALDDGSVDWSQFDNDGDGYVDVLAVMHPTQGAECSGGTPEERYNRVWSHRWNLWSASASQRDSWADPAAALQIILDQGYVTSTPAPGGGFIKIDDYTIQGVVECSTLNPNTIGVVAHELGHGFGLPDLYNTGSYYSHDGIGNWGLMGTGSWGCNGASSWRPCHVSAWSRSVLGWGDEEVLPPGTDPATLTLPPVETARKIFRIDAGDGSGEYLLLENRQRTGFDANLYAPGLLVWHIDPDWITSHRYSVNSDPNHMGVWLRQADGLNELGQNNGGRGDDGDPFPGSEGNTAFHVASNPASRTHAGDPFGATLLEIQQVGSDMSFQAFVGYRTLTLRTEGTSSGGGLITVDGVPAPSNDWALSSAPFQTHSISASAGEEVETGVRVAFQGWDDGAPRVREYTTQMEDATLTATYGGREVHMDIALTSPVSGVLPGQISFLPGDAFGWVPEGEVITVTAVANTGFGFLEWTGALAGRENPTSLAVTGPMDAGAVFEVTFSAAGNETEFDVPAATSSTIDLLVENANMPVTWSLVSGTVPEQMIFYTTGELSGVPMVRGVFPLDLHVQDALGLEDDLSITVEVTDPEISLETLASPFLLTGTGLNANYRSYLDNEGNQNGQYDLGDLRAFWLRNPDASATSEISSLPGDLTPDDPPGEPRGPESEPNVKVGKEERP